MIDILSADYPKRELSQVFNIPRSTYYSYQQRKDTVNTERERLKARVISLHQASRQAAGSRTLTGQLKQQGERIGRYKVRRLIICPTDHWLGLLRQSGFRPDRPGTHHGLPRQRLPQRRDVSF